MLSVNMTLSTTPRSVTLGWHRGRKQHGRAKVGMGKIAIRLFSAAVCIAGTLGAAASSRAQDCPGNPDAIGVSRVLELGPGSLMRVGKLQYRQTLPLADHEVVLTFDDGPLPPSSNKVLDTLAAQCVKATFFLVGEMAQNYPAVVRRMYQEGHTLGTHSEDHPLRFDHLSPDKVRWEIDQGIANVGAALGDPAKLAPYFRIPGLGRTTLVENELASRSLITFSVDVVADDWHRRIAPAQIVARAISRLEARGKGILLLHDIHPATAAALPELLKQLKEHGFRIVQVVPGPPSAPEMVAEAAATWAAAAKHGGGALDWPQAASAISSDVVALPVPEPSAFAAAEVLAALGGNGEIEAGVQLADAADRPDPTRDQPPASLAAVSPDWPEPTMQNIGLPPKPAAAEHDAVRKHTRVANVGGDEHEQPHHGRHRGLHRAKSPAAEGKRAGLITTLAALLHPAAPAQPTRTAAR